MALLASMYHVSTPRRSPWRRNVPGAVLAMAIWIGASYVVRISLEASMGGSSIYGPLSTPIVLLVWLYALAVAILIGAGLNAAANTLWPVALHEGADVRLVNWAMEGAGGLLTRAEGDAGASDADRPTAATLTPDGASRTAWTAGRRRRGEGRGRDQQFESGDRGPITAAIQRRAGGSVDGCRRRRRTGPRGPREQGSGPWLDGHEDRFCISCIDRLMSSKHRAGKLHRWCFRGRSSVGRAQPCQG